MGGLFPYGNQGYGPVVSVRYDRSATTVGPGVHMARTAHRNQVAERVGTARRSLMGVPAWGKQNVRTPATRRVVVTDTHDTLAPTTSTLVQLVPRRW